MALARIITRSQVCSRQLALDLLARGYAVEIVSPDAIPDNLADLELRVEEDPGNQLVASVETHDGERSASLKFLHHLKAPMGDFMRRAPEPREVPQLSAPPVTFHAEPGSHDAERPKTLPTASKTIAIPCDVLSELGRRPEPLMSVGTGASPVQGGSKTRQQDAASRITPSQQTPPLQHLPRPSRELPKYFAVEEPTILRPMVQPAMTLPARKAVRRDPAARWRWWTGLAFASLAMMALGFGFGLRRTENASAQVSGAVPAEKVAAASIDANLMNPVDTGQDSAEVAAAALTTQKKSQVAMGRIAATPSTAGTRATVARRHQDDLVAPNTITYLDRHFDPRASAASAGKGKPSKQVAHRPSARKHRGDVIAANKVTYLDKPTAKAAK